MFTVNRLFYKRLVSYYKFQFANFRSVVDWTVALYLVIPGLLTAGYFYMTWWQAAPPWIEHIPYFVMAILLFILATRGTVRLFVEDGDQLFLLQRVHWFSALLKRGLMYTLIVHCAASAVFVMLLAPLLLLQYELSSFELVILFVFICCFRVSAALLGNLLSVRFNGWRYGLLITFVQLFMAVLFVFLVLTCTKQPLLLTVTCMGLALLTGWMIRRRLRVKGAFYHDVDHEQKQKMKFAALLLSTVIEKRPRQRRRKPLLFSNSNLIFRKRTPASGLAEMFVKSFFRSWTQIRLYLQFVLIAAGALSFHFMPGLIKGALWLAFGFLLVYWMKTYGKEMLSSEFVQLFAWKKEDSRSALVKAVFIMALPGFLIISAAFGISISSWSGLIVMIPAGGLVIYAISKLLTPW
ncbi:ABC transporter permease [Paenibacillus eucommiae]|uniref:ABC-2 type transport system permease protein n=1 Tax=Paenibacillus eucommiae TaxID=1355755 RepID=A0ABS4IR63_9BACL|nr:ABC transporter permease [Paenibacillus eucommiae]MBP1990063.1 ABC-2 type transport system permease protein [Paenibacillus eucommiae]